jgi:hypothetical protein
MVVPVGLEPTQTRLSVVRFDRLSHSTIKLVAGPELNKALELMRLEWSPDHLPAIKGLIHRYLLRRCILIDV